jgi:outer membrane protein OmpA-like peptidoglycan-associated protein
MRFSHAIALAGLCLAATSAVPAMAQYAGQDVSVNPAPGGRGVLLYPGGQYTRSVPALLQPGENPNAPIQLHMPTRRRAPALARAEAPAVAAQPKPVRQAAAPAPEDSSSGYHSDYPDVPTPPPAKPAPVEKPVQKPAAKPAPEKTKIARAEPAPSASAPPPVSPDVPLTPGLTKKSVILFAAAATDPSQSALGAIKFLAQELNKDLTGPSSRIQLQAFGGTPGDKGSDARRLSLKRALAIRQVLIDDGVPADRIDVHAGGGADDSGPTDRVDVYVKA